MKKLKLKIQTLGCKVNQYDSDYLKKRLMPVFSLATTEADLVLVNTCVVTKNAIAKARNIIRKAKKENPNARVIVVGCWPMVYKSDALKLDIDLEWGVGNLDELIIEIYKIFGLKYGGIVSDANINIDKSRYFIKVQEGCEQYCAYCVIPFARGRLQSRDQSEIVLEIESAVRQGYKEVILSGTHLGLYGANKMSDKPVALVELLKKIISIKGLERIRLSSIEVNEITDELIDLMLNNRKICRHLHIPLQSGNDKILNLMNRPYDTKIFANKINLLRKKIPFIAISTDIIVGFPNESNEDFDMTYQFTNEMAFSKIHVFPFSAHEKSPSFRMTNHVPAQAINERALRLRHLSQRMEWEYRKNFVGHDLMVIVEKSREKNKLIGKTEYYFDVDIENSDKNNLTVGSLIKYKLEDF